MRITRGRWVLIGFLVVSITAAGAVTYKQWPRILEKIRKQPAESQSSVQVSSTPPFSTKEPDRYQATRIIINSEMTDGTSAGATTTDKSVIARDGESRREEFNSGTEAMTVYLQTGAGSFLLFPARKLFADLNEPAAEGTEAEQNGVDFSPNRLLHETSAEARYQIIGSEKVDGRKTTKYQVTDAGSSNASHPASVSLVWIDEELGMPIRSETSSTDKNNPAKTTVELRDIKREVDARLFEFPSDYAKVGIVALRAEIVRARSSPR